MSNIIISYDTETTGIPDWKVPSDSEHQPHIVSIAAIVAEYEEDGSYNIVNTLNTIVRPDGWEIPQETVDIHGVTTEYAQQVGIPEDVAINTFLEMWDFKTRVAHNRTFDERIIRIGLKRFFKEDNLLDTWKNSKGECTGLMTKNIMKLEPKNKFGYKMPKLEEAYEHIVGKKLIGAHDAYNDALACLEIYIKLKTNRIE